jgi:hypothetical protein
MAVNSVAEWIETYISTDPFFTSPTEILRRLKLNADGGTSRMGNEKQKAYNRYVFGEKDFKILKNISEEDARRFPNIFYGRYRDKETADFEGWSGYGVWVAIRARVLQKKEISEDLLELFIRLYAIFKDKINSEYSYYEFTGFQTPGGNRSRNVYRIASDEQIKEVLSYIVEKYSDKLFELTALKTDFQFDSFDKEITAQINAYLDTDPLIPVLNYAYTRDLGSQTTPVVWMGEKGFTNAKLSGPQLPTEFSKFIDTSLYKTGVTYVNPLDFAQSNRSLFIDNKKDFENNVRLPAGTGFSKVEIADEKLDTSGWLDSTGLFGGDVKTFVKNAYAVVAFDLLSSLEMNDGKFNYNYSIEQFQQQAQKTIEKDIEFEWVSPGDLSSLAKRLPLKQWVAKRILDAYRLQVFNTYIKEFKGKKPEDITNEELKDIAKQAAANGEKAAENLDALDVDPDSVEGLTEEQIKDKQKFLKQCILMSQLDLLKGEHLTNIASGQSTIHKKGKTLLPYGGRFFMVKDGEQDQSSTMSKLLIPRGSSISEFLNIRPSTAAFLVPKLRFYKVFTNTSGELEEFEFKFRNFTDSKRVENLVNTTFDRGGDFGVKSFDISFNGTTPATAKNDIKAELKLYFQSFGDFIQPRTFNGHKHAFVDLLLLPAGQKEKDRTVGSNLQYSPDYYRIRVDVGWVVDSARGAELEESIGVDGARRLRHALRLINKTYYLNMVDHSMDFREDGSLDISVSYRAYVESALKGTTMDALASKEVRKSVDAANQDYQNILASDKCEPAELNKVRAQLAQVRELLKKQSLQSILKRLIKGNFIRFKKANRADANSFARRGFLTRKVRFETPKNPTALQNKLNEKAKKSSALDASDIEDVVDTLNTDAHLVIPYFYMADLLYVILDAIYDDSGNKFLPGTENFKFVLTSFQYQDILSDKGNGVINIGSIPISVDIFSEWFTENVLKSDRTSYPIMYFIRDLCKYLITQIMSEECFRSSMDRSLMFKTANFLGKKSRNTDPFYSMYGNISQNSGNIIIDVAQHYGSKLPMGIGESNFGIKDLYNYIVIYAHTPIVSTDKEGKEYEDSNNGIIHFKMGRDRGILKRIKFAKTDMQYLREARYFNHGQDGLLQLAAVYKVSLELIGNTLYYPGMEVFINPMGFLGASREADPTVVNSVANKLGFGGYHLVTNVKSSIGPGKFTTTVDALFHYSGDRRAFKLIDGQQKTKATSEVEGIEEKPEGLTKMSDACNAIYSTVISNANDIVQNREAKYKSIGDIDDVIKEFKEETKQ